MIFFYLIKKKNQYETYNNNWFKQPYLQKDANEIQKKLNQILLVKSEPDIRYLYSLITGIVFRKLEVEIVEK